MVRTYLGLGALTQNRAYRFALSGLAADAAIAFFVVLLLPDHWSLFESASNEAPLEKVNLLRMLDVWHIRCSNYLAPAAPRIV